MYSENYKRHNPCQQQKSTTTVFGEARRCHCSEGALFMQNTKTLLQILTR